MSIYVSEYKYRVISSSRVGSLMLCQSEMRSDTPFTAVIFFVILAPSVGKRMLMCISSCPLASTLRCREERYPCTPLCVGFR